MPSLITTPGPIHHFVTAAAGTQSAAIMGGVGPFYLGTCIIAPKPKAEKFKIPVQNDLGGRSVPFQLVKDGERWDILTAINRFDLAVARNLRNLDGGGAVLGSETGYARGTLVIGVSDFSLIMVNGYAGNPAGNNPILNGARQFFSCSIFGYEESTEGTRVLEVAMAIKADNVYNPITRGFSCYTESVPNWQSLLALVT